MSLTALAPLNPDSRSTGLRSTDLRSTDQRSAEVRPRAALRLANTTDSPARPTHPRRVESTPQKIVPVPARPRATAPAADAPTRLRPVPNGTRARGFALYVGFDEEKAEAAGTDLGHIVEALKRLVAEIAPGSGSYAAVALAPEGVGGSDLEVVRLALQDPAAVARHRPTETEDEAASGVVVDISRKRLLLDNETVGLTYKEFELLQYLVLREGRTVDRTELIESLWSGDAADGEVPNERTIDVHIRRLRSKLGRYEDIVRTVRGAGYRFDRHADVVIRHASAPSPDLF
jgi:DNA-binding winged helix-turn-helix (wHTH) protein